MYTKKTPVLLLKNMKIFTQNIVTQLIYLIILSRECRDKFFQAFEKRCTYVINFTNMVNDEARNIIFIHKQRFFKFQFYGLNKKINNAQNTVFRFNEAINLAKKIDLNHSNININQNLKMSVPIKHFDFIRIVSQKPEDGKSVCTERNKHFQFACR